MVGELIDKLIDFNIHVDVVEEDKLRIHTDIATIPSDLLREIKLHKADLIRYLTARGPAGDFAGIPRAVQAKDYPLSSMQRRLWFLSQFEGGNAPYNVPRAYLFEGALDLDLLAYAFAGVIERHESLRTIFKLNEVGEVRQYILPSANSGFQIAFQDLRKAVDREQLVRELVRTVSSMPFDLSAGPLIRAALYQVEDTEWVFIYVLHHINSDGWSLDILLRELLLLYKTGVNGPADPLPPLRIQYKDYAAWQQEQLSGAILKKHRDYWLKQFEGELPVLDLPGDLLRPERRTFNGTSTSKTIGSATYHAIKSFSHAAGGTLFMGCLATVNALFYRYTWQTDIVIGTPVAGRDHVDLENQIGFYANTLALRTRLRPEGSFRQLLETVRQVTLGAYEHQVYPFDELVDELHLRRDPSRNPLFDVQVIVRNAEGNAAAAANGSGPLTISAFEGYGRTGSVFDMVIYFVDTGLDMQMSILYNDDVFSQRSVVQLADHLERMLVAVTTYPDKPISRLDYLTQKDREQLLDQFNGNPLPVSRYPITDQFRAQVVKFPEVAAVVYRGVQLTYRQLEDRSDQLASYLRTAYRVLRDQVIGIMLDRSEKMLIAVLAVLKAGAAYVPIDPEYPDSRKEFIVKDTALRILITETAYIFGLDFYRGEVFAIDVQLEELSKDVEYGLTTPDPSSLAYIIYTSGSTGGAKGVMIERGAFSASIHAQRPIFDIREGERVLQFSSSSFDVSIFEIFITICSGGSLYIIDEEDKKDPVVLERFIAEHEISVVAMPPAYLRMLDVRNLGTVRKLITGGEPAVLDMVLAFSRQGTYYNAYGPTESSLCASVFPIGPTTTVEGRVVPIGKPIAGVRVYVMDEYGGLCPIGVIGEICIAGLGLARGYLGKPELTVEKFVLNPKGGGERMYKTGDLGRWLPDGNLVFVGRKDEQVKINGYRIEPGEIEAALLEYRPVSAAIVQARPNAEGQKELVAYITGGDTLDIADLRVHLSRRIPAYMLPNHFIRLEAFPLTTNGKINRKKLPAPGGLTIRTGARYTAPLGEMEKALVRIWEDILGRDDIGVKDDYFELGGSSLKAMVVVKRILDETGISVPLKIIFEQKTIENIAGYIGGEGVSGGRPENPDVMEGGDLLPQASYNQMVYFSEWNNAGDDVTVTPYEYAEVDTAILEQAVNQLIQRHEILRTVFIEVGGAIRQKVLSFRDALFRVRQPEPLLADLNSILEAGRSRRFDLSSFPLFHMDIYRRPKDGYYIILTIHHIITDGYSGGVMQHELGQLFSAIAAGQASALPPLPFQYRDFSAWQRKFVASDEGDRHKRYWLKKLNGFTAGIAIPRPGAVAGYSTSNLTGITEVAEGRLYEELQRFSRENGVTMTVVLMGVLTLTLQRLSGQNDITLLTTVSGRNSEYFGSLDVSGLIGFFANLLPVRNVVDQTEPISEYLSRVQRNFLDDLGHGSYPFERLIRELPGIKPAEFLNAAVIYNYHNYQHLKESVFEPGKAAREEKKGGDAPVRFACSLAVSEFKNCLRLKFIFNDGLFGPGERDGFTRLFIATLQQILH